MIVGNGMAAKKFLCYKKSINEIIFASGVSDSQETRMSEYEREFKLLKNTIEESSSAVLIYFSTCSMYDPASKDSRYVQHKLEMESYIKKNCSKFIIFRVTQIVGNTQNNTVINYFKNKILSGKAFEVWRDSNRNLVDIDDVFRLVEYIINNKLFTNKIVNIANSKNIHVLKIIKILETVLQKKAHYHVIEKGALYENIDISMIVPLLGKLNISFNESYYDDLLEKYSY